MTTLQNQQPAQVISYNDNYDPEEDARLRDSPLLKPHRPNLGLEPSPPPMFPLPEYESPSPESSPGSPGRKLKNRPKSKTRASIGDGVLVHYMDPRNDAEIARQAAEEPLPSDDEEQRDTDSGGVIVDVSEKRMEGPKKEVMSVAGKEEEDKVEKGSTTEEKDPAHTQIQLAALASSALQQTVLPQAEKQANGLSERREGDPMTGVTPTIPSIKLDPAQSTSPNAPMKIESPSEELPPIQQRSPESGMPNGTSTHPITLPSITAQLGDINHLQEASTPRDAAAFSQSPPAPPLPRFSAVPGHGSPPKSPNNFRSLPSPGQSAFYYSQQPHRRLSSTDGPQYSSAADYSSSNTETPSTDNSGSTPANLIDRMSIDGITNPQIGGFQCTQPGCTAQPFQTQYLLNSHANVHSSNRPHYCGVKGCPRSEGGKGFKRKNEMIRHGLVHDSPGYVCPFCPDREHKYPRPDNLQRHVRVHHVDKDKDDAQLREVLAQRPEGPSRGRRRRGGTG